MPLPSVDRFATLSAADLRALREAFARDGFTAATVEATSAIAAGAPGALRLAIVRSDLRRNDGPGQALARLFACGDRVERAEIAARLGATLVERLLDAGVLRAEGAHLASAFELTPIGPVWILADSVLDAADSVMPPGPTTVVLSKLLPDSFPGSVLDVGCGPGSLALCAAARGARRVLGTDVNPRAIAIARLNALWNGLDAEFRAGDLIEPAAGERFDLVVSQPPFITQPEGEPTITFLHGGARGDAVTLRLIAGLPRVLAESGEALVLCDVPLGENQDLGTYLDAAVSADDLHVLALHMGAVGAESHALFYTRPFSTDTGPDYQRRVIEHRAHLDALGIRSFRHTLFVARRPGPARREAWRVAFGVADIARAGAAVRERLWSAIRSAGESEAVLLRRRIRVAPGAEWVSLRHEPEGEQSEHRIRFGPAWPAMEQIVSDEGVVLASLLERSERVEDAIAGYAERCDARPDEVRKPLLDYIRQSLLSGMLVPEESARGG